MTTTKKTLEKFYMRRCGPDLRRDCAEAGRHGPLRKAPLQQPQLVRGQDLDALVLLSQFAEVRVPQRLTCAGAFVRVVREQLGDEVVRLCAQMGDQLCNAWAGNNRLGPGQGIRRR
jgi:hypothetical protein